jgi:hypothetical protein
MNPQRRRRFGVRLAEIQRRTGIPHDSILRDHALSYMLAGVADNDELVKHAVFKRRDRASQMLLLRLPLLRGSRLQHARSSHLDDRRND